MTTSTLHLFIPRVEQRPSCDRCSAEIKVTYGVPVRRGIDGHGVYYYCSDCVGFTLSRYSYSYVIPNPTEEELKYKELYDLALESILSPVHR